MEKVYFKKLDGKTKVSDIAYDILIKLLKEERVILEKEVPIKVHFGEKGNVTFIKPECYDGMISFLKRKKIKSSFIETNVLYSGARMRKEDHVKIAKIHGFNRIPIIIADGDCGEDFNQIVINKKHFVSCMLGKEYSRFKQTLVLAHFKGHTLAGFGGAIKQLAMGFASRGGKLAMHMDVKPRIKNSKCIQCNLCKKECPVNAITIGEKSFIDKEKCIGCAACTAVCKNKAITLFSFGMIFKMMFGKRFYEKLAEYAYAAHHGKKNIYMNFALDITKGCDCMGKEMKPIMDDIGVFASMDPVALDQACLDLAKKNGRKFKGEYTLKYAEEIGVGTKEYELINV